MNPLSARIRRVVLSLAIAAALPVAANPPVSAANGDQAAPTEPAGPASCNMTDASSWIEDWLEAWDLVSREILKVPDAPPPEIVFYDSLCVYTTSALTGTGISRPAPFSDSGSSSSIAAGRQIRS